MVPFSAVRLLIDYRPALRERTGVGEFVHELARALSSRAGERSPAVTLFTSSWKDRPAAALALEMPAAAIADVKVPVRGLVWAWNRLEWPPVEWLAGHHDVVHSQSPLLIPTTRAARVVTVHDLDFLRHPEQMTAEIRRDYPTLARAHASRADAVMVSSQYAASEVTRELHLAPSRVHVCPPGRPQWSDQVARVRLERTAQGGRTPGTHILFMGTLSLRKNVGTLLEAYARLRAAVPDAPPLVLAGHRTAASARWEQRCTTPPLAGRVHITGYVDMQQRIDLYTNAVMLVLPSYEEGFGLPVLEAMACGVPVVVSSRGSLPEVAGPAAAPIDPDDAAAFALEMQRLLDSGTAAAARDRGLAQAARYSWQACADAAMQTYATAMEVHAHRR
jgi:glycosyltransferase involved in cell wall biosynthesis